ncbi:MAG: hypothetical protein AUK27_03600 [Deltaproteobacteria bacterium CG2_30_66_27]|nr:MAG: hypothetical protein AUK27_03600 [Deltaproteobacteria bacterium CG2_30_66_27]
MPPNEVLIVDDDRLIRWALEREFASRKIDARSVATAADALAEIRRRPCDLVFVAANVPDAGGVDLLREIRGIRADAKVVVMGGDAGETGRQHAFAGGALQFLEKPFSIQDVHNILRTVFDDFPRRRETPRYFCRIPLRLSIVDPAPEEAQYDLNHLSGTAADFGTRGLRLYTGYPLRVGQRVRARADEENGHFRKFVPPESPAQVVWVAPAAEGVMAGLRFVG